MLSGTFSFKDTLIAPPAAGRSVTRAVRIQAALCQLPSAEAAQNTFGRGQFTVSPLVKTEETLTGDMQVDYAPVQANQ